VWWYEILFRLHKIDPWERTIQYHVYMGNASIHCLFSTHTHTSESGLRVEIRYAIPFSMSVNLSRPLLGL
jgi:hypothetical protein